MCGSVRVKEDSRFPSHFHCQNCKYNFELSNFVCPRCLQQKTVLDTAFGGAKIYLYCPHCTSISDFFLCPFSRDNQCMMRVGEDCIGLGVKTDKGGLYRKNLSCENMFLSASYFKFTLRGKEVPPKRLLKILNSAIQTGKWAKNLTITAMFKLIG